MWLLFSVTSSIRYYKFSTYIKVANPSNHLLLWHFGSQLFAVLLGDRKGGLIRFVSVCAVERLVGTFLLSLGAGGIERWLTSAKRGALCPPGMPKFSYFHVMLLRLLSNISSELEGAWNPHLHCKNRMSEELFAETGAKLAVDGQ